MKPVHKEVAEILASDEDDPFVCPKQIRKKAMDFLARREYGMAELINKLSDKGYLRSTVEEQLAGLANEGLQSDARFTEAFVQSRINQGKGPVRIRSELGQKGVADSFIDAAVKDAPVDWYELAIEIRTRKFGPEIPGDFKEKARQMRFLQYRGFESDHIQSAI